MEQINKQHQITPCINVICRVVLIPQFAPLSNSITEMKAVHTSDCNQFSLNAMIKLHPLTVTYELGGQASAE